MPPESARRSVCFTKGYAGAIVGALQHQVPPDVKGLLNSLEIVPMLDGDGVPVMDVPAILSRRPQVCLVDGLAYDNPAPSRHAHRWQDVEELLSAGINVVGSVNLQYIDDQCEAVEQITGKRVTQTIPRAFLNTADEIVIVDAPCDSTTEQLPLLREKALLLSADVIDSGLQRFQQSHGIEPAWGGHESLLVCLTAHANVTSLIASARRSASRFHCDVVGVYVKQPRLSNNARRTLEEILEQARAAGMRVDALEGNDPVETVVQYARSHGVTQIFVGHGIRRNWWARLFGSPVSKLIRAAHGMDVRVVPN